MVLPRLVALLLAVTCVSGERRAKLNSIKTVPREPHATAASRTLAGSAQIYPCSSDLACAERSFCHAPSRNPSQKSCHACRRRARSCHRDAMCCHCSNNVCTPLYDRGVSHRIPAVEEHPKLAHRKKGGWRKKTDTKLPPIKGHAGDPCLRTSDCSEGHCCARHFWERICKPVLKQGEVCTRHRRKEQLRLELFQRCACGEGLACKAHLPAQRSTPSSTPSPTPLSRVSLKSPETVAAKGRLHLCQRM